MLETLYDIDWGNYYTAFTTANEIPKLLEALTSPDDAVMNHAAQELDEVLYHQGDVYESTLMTIPFLIEILAQSRDIAAYRIMVLLNAFRFSQMEPTEENIALDKRISDAVRVGTPLYARYIEHEDKEIREAATHLYMDLHEDRAAVFERACRRLKVEDGYWARDSLFNALVRAIRHKEVSDAAQSTGTRLLESLAESEGNPSVSIEAAISLIRILGPKMSIERLNRLVDKILRLIELQEDGRFSLILGASRAFNLFSVRERIRLRIRLLEGCDTWESADTIADELLQDAFELGQTITTLTVEQQLVVSSFLKKELLWQYDFLGRKLKTYGLPGDRESLRHFVTS